MAAPQGAITTPRQLMDALAPGQVGCFRAGLYSSPEIDVRQPGVTLQSYPGQRATIAGRIVIEARNVTIQGLNLDGAAGPADEAHTDRQCQAIGGCTLPSVSISAPGATIVGNDITNTKGICVDVESYRGLRADHFEIERNRIHDCKPADNHIHGVYIGDGANGVIEYNVIFDNGDRGIQLYPDASGNRISYNTIDGNRTNLDFGSDGPTAPSGNTVTHNIFSFPSTSVTDPARGLGARFNVEAYPQDWVGHGNTVTGNCAYTTATGYFGGWPVGSGISTDPGFRASGNIVGNPSYVDRGRQNYALRRGSPCAGSGAPPDVTAPR